MNALAEFYAGQDLEILGFPCNQFGYQEPSDTADEIMNGIRNVRPGDGFEPQMTFFQKIEVNGATEDPLYTFLKSACGTTFTTFDTGDGLFYEPLRIGDIYWNFEKFLIGRDGKPYSRYHPAVVEPGLLKNDINTLLAA